MPMSIVTQPKPAKKPARRDIRKLIRSYEKSFMNEVDTVLIRVFKKAAHKAWVEGNMRDFQLYNQYLRKVKEL